MAALSTMVERPGGACRFAVRGRVTAMATGHCVACTRPPRPMAVHRRSVTVPLKHEFEPPSRRGVVACAHRCDVSPPGVCPGPGNRRGWSSGPGCLVRHNRATESDLGDAYSPPVSRGDSRAFAWRWHCGSVSVPTPLPMSIAPFSHTRRDSRRDFRPHFIGAARDHACLGLWPSRRGASPDPWAPQRAGWGQFRGGTLDPTGGPWGGEPWKACKEVHTHRERKLS